MARLPRIKDTEERAWYHICARVAGGLDWYPFDNPFIRQKLLALIKRYLAVFCCEAAAFCLMGNHYHLVLCFEPFRLLEKEELHRRASLIYRDPDRVLLTEEHWRRFNERIFDLSELMRVIQSEFAKWYNRTSGRRGALWAERFKSVLLERGESVVDAILYVELNPVRAGLVERPEDWQWSSAALRFAKRDSWLVSLSELFKPDAVCPAQTEYRSRLYHRGAVSPGKPGSRISPLILQEEITRGFARQGSFRRRIRLFTEGVVLGSEIMVRDWVNKLRQRDYYRRRKNPVVQRIDGAICFTLREHRPAGGVCSLA